MNVRWTKRGAALELAVDGVVVVNFDGTIILANTRARRLFGDRALVGTSVELLLPTALRAHARALCVWPPDGAVGNTVAMSVEGRQLQVEITCTPFPDEAEILTVCVFRDVSERHRLNAEDQRLRDVVEFSDEAIISKTLDGVITSWNRGAERTFEHLRRDQGSNKIETVRRRKDGRDIDVLVTISPIRSLTGEMIGASKVARDITDRKKAEAKFRSLLEGAPAPSSQWSRA